VGQILVEYKTRRCGSVDERPFPDVGAVRLVSGIKQKDNIGVEASGGEEVLFK